MTMRVKLVCNGFPFEVPSNPYPMYPHIERLNHVVNDSATGQRHVFNGGPTRVSSSIFFKAVHYNVAKAYENFLVYYAEFGKVPFKIECPDYIDFGKGMGVDIPAAYYSGPPTLKDVITLRDDAGLYYDLEIPYMFVRED